MLNWKFRFSNSRGHEPVSKNNGPGDESTADEDFLKKFETLYNPTTGGWHLPDWIGRGNYFTVEKAAKWQGLPERYSPVEKEVGDLFATLVQLVRPSVILETGTNFGYSTAKIANALRAHNKAGTVYTIDINRAAHIFEQMTCKKNIQFLQGSSLEVDIDESLAFDMLFLDSDHHYDTIIKEIIRFEPLLRENGLMVLHDAVYYDGVALAVKQLMENSRFELVTLPSPRDHGINTRPPGVTVVRKIRGVKGRSNDIEFCQEFSGVEININETRNQHDKKWLVDQNR